MYDNGHVPTTSQAACKGWCVLWFLPPKAAESRGGEEKKKNYGRDART